MSRPDAAWRWLIRRCGRDLARHGLALGAVVLAFIVVGLAASAALGAAGPRGAQARAEKPALIIATLGDELDAAQTEDMSRALARLPGVGGVRLVSARDALSGLRAALGSRAAVLEGVGADLLANSLEVDVAPARAAALGSRLRRLRGITEVDVVATAGSVAPAGASPLDPPPAPRAARWLVAGAALLSLTAALIVLRARARVELAVLSSFGFTHAGATRPLVLLATAAAVVGAAAGMMAAPRAFRDALSGRVLSPGEWALALPAAALLGAGAAAVALHRPRLRADLADAS
jgi:FtsX extracellular domain